MIKRSRYTNTSDRDASKCGPGPGNPQPVGHLRRRHRIDGLGIFPPEISAPEVRDLLVQVRKGGVDLVAVVELDRAFRSAKDTYDTLAYLDTHRVGFVDITQPVDTTSSTGKLIIGVLAAVAELSIR